MINKESSLFDSQEKIDSQLEKFLQPLKYDEIGSTQILDEQSVEKSLSQGKCEKMQNESRGLREIKNNNPCEEVKKSNWLKKNISGSDKVDKAEKKKALLNCECGDSTEDSEMVCNRLYLLKTNNILHSFNAKDVMDGFTVLAMDLRVTLILANQTNCYVIHVC